MHQERKSESLLNSKLETPKQPWEGKWMKFASGKEGLAMLWDHYHCWLCCFKWLFAIQQCWNILERKLWSTEY